MSQQDQDSQAPLEPEAREAGQEEEAPPPPAPPKPLAWDRPAKTEEKEAFEDDFALGEGAREPEEPDNDFDALEPGPTEVVSFATSSRGRNGRGRDVDPEEMDEPPEGKGLAGVFSEDCCGPLLRHKGVALVIAAVVVALVVILAVAFSKSSSAPDGREPTQENAAPGPQR